MMSSASSDYIVAPGDNRGSSTAFIGHHSRRAIMGRFAELCGEVAAALEEDVDGLKLPPEAWDRFRSDWQEEDIEDAMGLVQESLMQDELVDAADSLSARMVDWLGAFGTPESFQQTEAGDARVSVDALGQLARRVARLEEALARYRDTLPPANPGFENLRQRLANHGIEDEMSRPDDEDGIGAGPDADEDDEDDA
jgi:hypothetical protein